MLIVVKIRLKILLSILFIWYGGLLNAKHIIGGEIYYDFLGSNNYRITLKLYIDCSPPPPGQTNTPLDPNAIITVFNSSGAQIDQFTMSNPVTNLVPASINNPCVQTPSGLCVQEGIYTTTRNYPPLSGGYYIVYQRCCRNAGILNLISSQSVGSTYVTHIPGPEQVAVNSSPRFATYPPMFICAGIDIKFNHKATDPDGDSLVYSLCPPYTGLDACCPAISSGPGAPSSLCPSPPPSCPTAPNPPPYINVPYNPPYNASYPLSSNPAITINPQTGFLTGVPNITGKWVVGVCVSEYRNGQLIGTQLRDFQFNVVACPKTIVSSFPAHTDTCGGKTVLFVNNSIGGTNYYWNFGDPNVTSDTANTPSAVYTYPDTGIYNVTLITYGSITACTDTFVMPVYVFPPIAATFTPPPGQCVVGNSFNFTVNGNFSPSAQFVWNFGFAGSLGTAFLQSPNGISFSQYGNIPISVTVYEKYCDTTISNFVQVYPEPIVKFSEDSVLGCAPLTVQFTNQSLVGTTPQYVWDFGDGQFSNITNPVHVYANPGVYTVSLQLSTSSGCLYNGTMTVPGMVTVLQSPVAGFDVSPVYSTIYENLFALTDSATGYTSMQVSMGDGNQYNFLPSTYSYAGFGPYTITQIVTSQNACTDTVTKQIYIEPDFTVYVPNAFTPHSSAGTNDVFKPILFGVKDYKLEIYNRWGQKIFESTDTETGWDGTYKGKKCESETYIWRIEFTDLKDGYPNYRTGQVHLIR